MSDTQDTENIKNQDSKSGLNPTSIAVFVIIAVLSVLVGTLWALNYTNSSTGSAPATEAESNYSPLVGDLENNRDIILWNATARNSIADALRVLDLSELNQADSGVEKDLDPLFFRLCRDIQGRDKALYDFAKVPNPDLQSLYVAWVDSVADIATTCAGVTEDTIDSELIDSKTAKSWNLFDSFFMGIEPFLERPDPQVEGQ